MKTDLFRKIILVLGFLLVATPVFSDTVVVEVKDSKFGPEQPLVIKVGDTVKWMNVEKRQYNLQHIIARTLWLYSILYD